MQSQFTPKIQWKRRPSSAQNNESGLELYVWEREQEGWKHYTRSRLRRNDKILKGNFGRSSYGFSTMQACLKAGYEYLEVSKEDKKKGDEL
jgi:hypothetical protein